MGGRPEVIIEGSDSVEGPWIVSYYFVSGCGQCG